MGWIFHPLPIVPSDYNSSMDILYRSDQVRSIIGNQERSTFCSVFRGQIEYSYRNNIGETFGQKGFLIIMGVTQLNQGIGIILTPNPITDTGIIANALCVGIAGGQTVIGGTAASENLTLSSTAHATKGKILLGTSAYDEVNNRLGVGTATPNSRAEIRTDAIANSISDTQGLFFNNATAATAIAPQQHSPPIVQRMSAWKTNATAASQTIDWRNYGRALSGGTTNALGRWVMERSIAGGAYTELFGVDQSGAVYFNGNPGTSGQIPKSQGSNNTIVWFTPTYLTAITSSDNSLTVATANAIINLAHTNVWTVFQGYTESSHSSTTAGEWWNDNQQHSMAFNLSGSSTDNAIKVWPTGCFYSMYNVVEVVDSGEQEMMVQL